MNEKNPEKLFNNKLPQLKINIIVIITKLGRSLYLNSNSKIQT